VVQPPGPEQHLHHPQKQADADDHHDDREKPTLRTRQRDVAEPGRGQRRDREIERIDIVGDRRVLPVLRLVNDRRHYKEKDKEMGSRDNRLVIAPDEREVSLHAARNAIGAKQAKHSEPPEKAEPVSADRRDERDDDRYVGEAQRVEQVVQAPAADRQADEELAEYDEPDRSVDKLEVEGPLDKRGCHQEHDC
jgi:hypothetical protein